MKQNLREDRWSTSLMGKVCLLEVEKHTSSINRLPEFNFDFKK